MWVLALLKLMKLNEWPQELDGGLLNFLICKTEGD